MNKTFTKESLKLLSKYTFMRKEILERDGLLRLAQFKLHDQEEKISDLRIFIESHQSAIDLICVEYNQNAPSSFQKLHLLEHYHDNRS